MEKNKKKQYIRKLKVIHPHLVGGGDPVVHLESNKQTMSSKDMTSHDTWRSICKTTWHDRATYVRAIISKIMLSMFHSFDSKHHYKTLSFSSHKFDIVLLFDDLHTLSIMEHGVFVYLNYICIAICRTCPRPIPNPCNLFRIGFLRWKGVMKLIQTTTWTPQTKKKRICL